MEFQIKQVKSATVIVLPSVLNFEANLALKEKLESLAAVETPRIGVDVSRPYYIGSLAVGLLSFANKLVKEFDGEFFLLAPNEKILQILEQNHVMKSLKIFNSESEIFD